VIELFSKNDLNRDRCFAEKDAEFQLEQPRYRMMLFCEESNGPMLPMDSPGRLELAKQVEDPTSSRNPLHFQADRLDLGVELKCFSTHFPTPT
jgi:hypothetical protein